MRINIFKIYFKAEPIRFKQLTKKLKDRTMSQNSIIYSIRQVTVVRIVGLQQERVMPTSEYCLAKIVILSAIEPATFYWTFFEYTDLRKDSNLNSLCM